MRGFPDHISFKRTGSSILHYSSLMKSVSERKMLNMAIPAAYDHNDEITAALIKFELMTDWIKLNPVTATQWCFSKQIPNFELWWQ
ncbi:hypothetical protein TNCV_5137661 [Trichonephila clavipes]|nr:hypothetical protein TNCV_5137661 [Trichonephila clavipes]